MRTYRCKQCREKNSIEGERITEGINRFCSKKCRLEFTREKARKEKEKVKAKKQKAKTKKQNSVSSLTKKADALWSEAVKIEYNYECQYC